MRPFEVGDRVRLEGVEPEGVVEGYCDAGRWLVIDDLGGRHLYLPSGLALITPEPPMPVAKPPKRPRWETGTACQYDVDTALADGWEPYAVTVEASERGYLARVYHLRRRVEVPDVT